MKYIVANANKSEDRLTQKDIDNAAKRTQIIKYITCFLLKLTMKRRTGKFQLKIINMMAASTVFHSTLNLMSGLEVNNRHHDYHTKVS